MVVILEAAQTSLVGYTNQLGVPQIPESELGFDLPLAARPAVPSKPCTDRIKGCTIYRAARRGKGERVGGHQCRGGAFVGLRGWA
jgi:hypothetical protein